MKVDTLQEVADELRCSGRKVAKVAREHGIGANLEGRAGWRFTETDKVKLLEAMKPKKAAPARRRHNRRRAVA